jgi:hypothetical protein
VASLALCVACGRETGDRGMSGQSIASPSVYVVALDTSSSAKEIHEQLYNRALQNMETMPRSARVIVVRFDSAAAEVYDGRAIVDGAEAGKLMKPELQWQSKTTGTNLARLFERIEQRIEGTSEMVRIDVYTDCGTEEMSAEDEETARRVTAKWKETGNVTMAFHGVETGFREKLRALVSFPVEID